MSLSPQATDAQNLVSTLQARFVAGLETVSSQFNQPTTFAETKWLRDSGQHGGGNRFSVANDGLFNQASVNVSQIHYGDLPEKKLGSATAISTIIHPKNPHAPSVHIHISWTEMKNGSGYWRIMADLNPSVIHTKFRDSFADCLQQAAPEQYSEAAKQGDRYFYIPALQRHRGVTHFYLESYCTEDPARDRDLAETVGIAAIDHYLAILEIAHEEFPEVESSAQAEQLAYHTLYLFQVLTLDRGTTSGLLVHDQNDLGIMGSLPSHIDRDLLASWKKRVEQPQDLLVQRLLDALPEGTMVEVSDETKMRLAKTVRDHYREHPEALSLQASGNVTPPTVENHR